MGIDANGLRFLLYAQSIGVDFSRPATIGRQRLGLSFRRFTRIVNSEFGCGLDEAALQDLYARRGFIDALLRYLGAGDVHSFDYSDYEGATHLHDLNSALPDAYEGRYTTLIEAGAIEHIFNFPVAIENCMRMVEVGGHYLGITPANNFMGHGFYQFSPELYFRIFSPENGFRVAHMFLCDGPKARTWYAVADPREVNNRVTLRNYRPTSLLIAAQRIDARRPFAQPPLQSDYVTTWHAHGTRRDPAGAGRAGAIGRAALFGKALKNLVRPFLGPRTYPDFYRPFRPSGKTDNK